MQLVYHPKAEVEGWGDASPFLSGSNVGVYFERNAHAC